MSPEAPSASTGGGSRVTRWVIFVVILLAVVAYVQWHGGDSDQTARSFLRHLFRALF